jgi:hypothetical protein
VRVPIHSPAGESAAGGRHFLPGGLAAAPRRRVAQVERALGDAVRPVKGSRIAILGVNHKPGVGYIRESPALKILTLLSALGAELRYHDPHVPTLPDHGLSSIPLEEALQDADLAVIVTAHPGVDHDTVLKRARLVVDLRGITRGTLVENVVRLLATAHAITRSQARRPWSVPPESFSRARRPNSDHTSVSTRSATSLYVRGRPRRGG